MVLATLGITFSCTNDVQEEWQSVNSPLKSNVQEAMAGNVVVTDKGELITIEDTTVYTVNISDNLIQIESEINAWDIPVTRVSDSSYPQKITVKGYDTKEKIEDYKKMIFSDAEKYGLQKGSIYLVCLYKVYKDLAQSDDESIKPRNYTTNLDDTAMGWLPDVYNNSKKFVKGFSCTTTSVNGFVTASTLLRYVKCDLSGASYDKFLPYAPQNLIWQYVLNYSEGWD